MNFYNKKILGVFLFVCLFGLFFISVSAHEKENQELKQLRAFKAAYPNSSIKYRGVVAMDVDFDGREDLFCDFGSQGLWACYAGTWIKINALDPEWIIGFKVNDLTFPWIEIKVLLADFGSSGLWHWSYQGSQTGYWKKCSSADADFAFAGDFEGDGGDELFVDFGSQGLWIFDLEIATQWNKVNMLSPESGSLKSNLGLPELEDGVFDFGSVGLWALILAKGWVKLNSLNPEDDNISADVDGVGGEELIIDFGSGIGTWLYDRDSWYKLNNNSPLDIRAAQFAAGGIKEELLCSFGEISGLWKWNYNLYPGIWTLINSVTPETDNGFCEPFDPDLDGWDEVAVDFGSLGLWLWEDYDGTWTKLNSNNPEFMVRADYWGDGVNQALVVDFGPGTGLWIYDGIYGKWYKLSSSSPDPN